MSALALLTAARDAGVKVTVEGANLVLEGDALTDDMVASFKAAKPEVLRLLAVVPEAMPATEPGHDPVDCNPPMEASVCDDCGKPATVLIVTDYGSRYCRACLRPSPLNSKPRTKGLSHA